MSESSTSPFESFIEEVDSAEENNPEISKQRVTAAIQDDINRLDREIFALDQEIDPLQMKYNQMVGMSETMGKTPALHTLQTELRDLLKKQNVLFREKKILLEQFKNVGHNDRVPPESFPRKNE